VAIVIKISNQKLHSLIGLRSKINSVLFVAAIITGVDNGKRIIEIKLPFRPDLKASPDTKHPIDVIEIVPSIAIIEK
tara:strand:- start:61 stop:291 length:231 start_codon:yes stop_codon:yes gene_type:complete